MVERAPSPATQLSAWLIGTWGCLIAISAALPSVREAFLSLDHTRGLFVDFGIYQTQARLLLAPQPSLAEHWLYPPFSALLFLGFGSLDDHTARLCWGAVEVLLCVLLGMQCERHMPSFPRRVRIFCALGLVLTSLPVAHCLKWGQLSVLLTLLGVLGLERAGWSGAWLLGSAVALKLYPASYAAGYLAQGRVRPVLKLSAAALLLGLVLPLAILGPAPTGMMIGRTLKGASALGQHPDVAYQTLPLLFVKWFGAPDALFEGGPFMFTLPDLVVRALAITSSATCILVTLWTCRRHNTTTLDAASVVSLMLCATLLLEPAWLHYYAMLPIGHAILLQRSHGRPRQLAFLLLSVSLSAGSLSACLIDPASFLIVQRAGTITLAGVFCLVGLWASEGAEPLPARP